MNRRMLRQQQEMAAEGEEERSRADVSETREEEEVVGMDRASEELERRSRNLSRHVEHRRRKEEQPPPQPKEEEEKGVSAATVGEQLKAAKIEDHRGYSKGNAVERSGRVVTEKKPTQLQQQLRIRASDMPPELQKRAFGCARETLATMPKLDSKRLALILKKEFDTSYGPAWHCIVGTSFGSYVTHSLGGFLYFSIDKVYILLFRTAVEPLDR